MKLNAKESKERITGLLKQQEELINAIIMAEEQSELLEIAIALTLVKDGSQGQGIEITPERSEITTTAFNNILAKLSTAKSQKITSRTKRTIEIILESIAP